MPGTGRLENKILEVSPKGEIIPSEIEPRVVVPEVKPEPSQVSLWTKVTTLMGEGIKAVEEGLAPTITKIKEKVGLVTTPEEQKVLDMPLIPGAIERLRDKQAERIIQDVKVGTGKVITKEEALTVVKRTDLVGDSLEVIPQYFIKGFLGEPIYDFMEKKRWVEPVYEPETTKERIGAIAGQISGDIASIILGFGLARSALLKVPSVAKFATTYPKVFEVTTLGLTGTALGQIKSVPFDAQFKERLKHTAIDFPSWVAWGVTGVGIPAKAYYKYIPAYFTIGFASAKLEGASWEDALYSGLTTGAIGSFFKILSIPKQTHLVLREKATTVLNKYGAKLTIKSTPKEIESAWKSLAHKYHPDKAGGNTQIMSEINVAYDVLNRSPRDLQRGLMEEIRDLYRNITNRPVPAAKVMVPVPFTPPPPEAPPPVKPTAPPSIVPPSAPPIKISPSREMEMIKAIDSFITAKPRAIEAIEEMVANVESAIKEGAVLNERDTEVFNEMKGWRDVLKARAAARIKPEAGVRPAEVPEEVIIKPLEEPEVKPGEKRISIFEQPLNQLGYVYYLIRTKQIVPEKLRWLVEERNNEAMRQIGEKEILSVKGKPGKYKINYGEELITEEGIEEFYPLEDYKEVKDWKKLQSGWGIDTTIEKGNAVWVVPSYPEGRRIGIVLDIYDTGEARLRTKEGIEEADVFSLQALPKTLTRAQKAELNALKSAMGIAPEVPVAKVPGVAREYPAPTNLREKAINDLLPRKVPYIKILKGEYRLIKTPEWWGSGYFLVKEGVPPEVIVALEDGTLRGEFEDASESIAGLIKKNAKAKPAEITAKGRYERQKIDVLEITSDGKKYYFQRDLIATVLKPNLGADLAFDIEDPITFVAKINEEIIGIVPGMQGIEIGDITDFVPMILPEAPKIITPKPPEAIKEVIPVEKGITITEKVGKFDVQTLQYENIEEAYAKSEEKGWELVGTYWKENLSDKIFDLEKIVKETLDKGGKVRLIKFKTEPGKRGLYKNYEGEWQKEPVYSYYFQKTEVPSEVKPEILPKPRKVKPIPEWYDEIDMIVSGRAIMRPPIETKTEWMEALGRGRYMKVFAGGEFAISPDEMATRLEITEDELREKIVAKFNNPAPKEEIEKTINRFASEEQRKALWIKAPWIAKAWSHGLEWSSLNGAQQEAVKLWTVQKRKGLPPEVLEQTEELRYYYLAGKKIEVPTKRGKVEYTRADLAALAKRASLAAGREITPAEYFRELMKEREKEIVEELRLPGISKRMRPQVIIDEAKKARELKESPARDFETLLNVKINPDVAFSKLVEIAKDLGIKIKVVELGWQDGKFSITRDGRVIRGIQVKDINDYVALTHELGHAIDFVVIGNKAYPKTLSERIGRVGTPKEEKMLLQELKRVSDFVRPFDRQAAKRVYLFYRNRRRELFADFISLYLTDTERAMTLAPYFTSEIEMRHPKLVDIRNKFAMPVTAIEPHDLPARNIRGIINGFLNHWQKVIPKEEVKIYKDQANAINKLGSRMLNIIGLPFWRGLSHPQFYKIYRAVQDEAIYGFNGLKAETLKTLNFKEFNALPDVSKKRVVKAIYTGNDKEIQKYFTDEELKITFRMTDEEINTYQRIVKVVKQATDNLIEARKLRYGFYELSPERQKELEPVIRTQIEKLGGYFPLDRLGETAVFGRVADPITGKETPFFALRENEKEGIKLANLLTEMGYKDVSVYPIKHLPPEFYRQIKRFSFSDLENLVEAVGIDAESPDIKAVKDYLAKAAWDKHLIKRKYVPGYERTYDNLIRTLVSFIESSTSRYSKAKASYEIKKAMKGIDPYKEPETYAYAQRYVNDFFYTNPTEFFEIRRGIYFYYLTFKTSFLLQNLTQPLITTLPEMANYVGGVKAPWYFNLALKDAALYLKAKLRGEVPKVDPTMAKMLDEFFEERVISGMMTEMLMGITHPKRQMIENVLGAFGIASESLNRTITGTAGYRVAKDYLKKTDYEEIKAFTKEMIEKTQFPYGSQNIPRFIAGAGTMKGLAKTIAVFKMFQLNYLHFLTQRVLKGSLGAKFWAFSTLAFLSGLFGMPFMYLINWVIRKLTGFDIRTEIRKKLGEGRQALADAILYGVPTFANLNLSYLIGLGDIISPERDPTNQIFGAGVGIINRMNWGIELIKQGKTQEGIAYLMPPFIGNIIQAQKWAEEGKEFKENVWTEFSKWEIAQRVLSFYPHKMSKQWEAKEIEADLYKRYKNIRSRFIEEMKKGKDFGEVRDKFEDDIEKHNNKVEEDLFILYEALGLDVSHKDYRSIEQKYMISRDDLQGWRDEAKEEMKRIK